MSKKILLLIFISTTGLFSQTFWERTEPFAGPLNQIHFAGGDTVYGSLNSGMTRSTDKGITWSNPIIVNFVRAFDVSPNGNIFVAQNQNKISRSTNKGASFSPITNGIDESACSAVLVTATGTVLTGTRAGIYRSSNNGDQWNKVAGVAQLNEDTNIVAFAKHQNIVYAFATMPNNNPEWTVAYRSTDDGQTWTKGANKNEGITAYKFIVASNGHIYSRTHRGVYRSTNNGDSWSLFAFQDISINDIALDASDQLYITIDESDSSHVLYKTTDGGSSWQSLETPYADFSTISIGKNGELFLRQDQTYRSTDNGVTWKSIAVTYPNVTIFKESPKQELYVTSGGSAYQFLYRSTNNGASWKAMYTGVVGIPIVGFYGDTLLVADNFYNAKLFRSIDNGKTFKTISSMTVISGYINAIMGTSYQSIIAGTTSGIYRSVNHGKAWTKVSNSPVAFLHQLPNGTMYGFRSFFGSGVQRSVDSGSTWTELKNGMGNTIVHSMAFAPNGNLFAGSDAGLFRSTDAGDNWVRIDTQKTIKPYGIFVTITSGGKLFFGGAKSGVNSNAYQSTDFGATWSSVDNNIQSIDNQATIRSLFASSGGYLFAGTSSGLFKSSGKVTSVNLNGTSVPNSVMLQQNYPNPFNPSTRISFTIPQEGKTILKVYDVLGKEVTTLVNEQLTAGSYETTFTASEFSSGIYFYVLENNNKIEARKMILLK